MVSVPLTFTPLMKKVGVELTPSFSAPWVRVKVTKVAPIAGVRQLGVVIERGERGARS